MKILKFQQAHESQNSRDCTALEYPLNDSDINVAVIKLNGRYPETGRVMNESCKEISYVIEGTGKLSIEGEDITVEKGDVVMIEPGDKYYWEGNLTMFVPCTPAWTLEQHKAVE